MRTREDVITVTAKAEQNTASITRTLNAGNIIGVMAYKSDTDGNNNGFIRASIKDASGTEVSKLQNLANYRSREAGYYDSFKPLQIEGGRSYQIEIVASEPFIADLLIDFIFIYSDENSNY